jgi:UDP-glucose 4-epimerase
MKILVTGGAGFIGSHLVDRLIAEGHDVTVLDNFLTGKKENLNPKAKLIEADITDFDSIEKYFKDIDAVFHMAAVARMAWAFDVPRLTTQTNVFGTVNVLDAARAHNVKRFINSSSYSIGALINPYAISKFSAEEFVRIYNEVYGLPTISLRYANVYGKRQSEEGTGLNLVASLKRSKREDGKIWITGDGTQTRDQIHVSDIVDANILALASIWNGHLDICTGKNISLNELAALFNCPIEYRPAKKADPKDYHPDPKPAEKILGFRAKIKLEEGIKDVL